MKKTNKLYLEQFLEYFDRIESILFEVSKESFLVSNLHQDAVIRNIQVIGEVSRRFSEDYKQNHQEIPWSKIIGMRNRLAHDYEGVNLEIVWITAKEFIPELKVIILKHLNNFDTTKY